MSAGGSVLVSAIEMLHNILIDAYEMNDLMGTVSEDTLEILRQRLQAALTRTHDTRFDVAAAIEKQIAVT